MANNQALSADPVLSNFHVLLPDIEALYKDVHSHPELSMQENRTAGLAAERLGAAGYEVTTGIGKTGVVGLLRNGKGPTVMLRADMDALPIQEETGLPYASKATATDREGQTVPVSHMCYTSRGSQARPSCWRTTGPRGEVRSWRSSSPRKKRAKARKR